MRPCTLKRKGHSSGKDYDICECIAIWVAHRQASFPTHFELNTLVPDRLWPQALEQHVPCHGKPTQLTYIHLQEHFPPFTLGWAQSCGQGIAAHCQQ